MAVNRWLCCLIIGWVKTVGSQSRGFRRGSVKCKKKKKNGGKESVRGEKVPISGGGRVLGEGRRVCEGERMSGLRSEMLSSVSMGVV